MSFLENYQQSFMLLLSGICATIALFVFLTKTIRPKRRMALLQMEVGSVVLLMAERFAYSYRGDPNRWDSAWSGSATILTFS